MDTFADMSMEMKIGDNPFEEDRFFGDTAEGTEENALDGFLPVTGPVPDNPFENGTEQADRLPVMGESAEAGEPVETEEENACPEEDAGEEGESEEKETDATESDAEKESEDIAASVNMRVLHQVRYLVTFPPILFMEYGLCPRKGRIPIKT